MITENYMSHYLYMTPRVYEQTFGEMPSMRTLCLLWEDCKDDLEMAGTGSLLILVLSASVIPVVWHHRLTVC